MGDLVLVWHFISNISSQHARLEQFALWPASSSTGASSDAVPAATPSASKLSDHGGHGSGCCIRASTVVRRSSTVAEAPRVAVSTAAAVISSSLRCFCCACFLVSSNKFIWIDVEGQPSGLQGYGGVEVWHHAKTISYCAAPIGLKLNLGEA